MTQERTYPAHIIAAAKALAEKHGVPSWAVRDWGHLQAALCEAILTTLPSEEAMMHKSDCAVHNEPAYPNGPCDCGAEPTEDHLRRACEELKVEAGAVGVALNWPGHPVEGRDVAIRTVARLLAERDAMQARVDGWQDITTAPKDGTWFVAAQNGETYPCEWRVEEPDEGAGKAGWWDHFNQSFEEPTHWMPTASAEPAPDPDLVLAREAAESMGLVDTATKMIAESVALRALKLAKEQG